MSEEPKFPTLPFACFAIVGVAALFFTVSALTDFVYSDCINVGTQIMSCLSGAKVLYPLVGPVGHGYLLGNYATPDGMGRIAGISFLWMFAGYFLWVANRKGRTWKRVGIALADSTVFVSAVYMVFMIGVVLFIPYCLAGSCRISNEVPWLNYIQGFYIATIAVASYVLARVWGWILKERRVNYWKRKIVAKESPYSDTSNISFNEYVKRAQEGELPEKDEST